MSDVAVQNEPEKKDGGLPQTQQPSESSVVGGGGALPPALDSARGGFAADCVFNDNIKILSSQPLPHYDKGPVKAYAARGTEKVPTNLFAMICEDHLSPRTFKASNYAAIINPALPRLVASGIVDWAPAGKQKYCFIYENTLGQPLMREDTRGGLGMKPDLVLNAVIRPMISVLQDMRDKDIIHGSIRPSNMFDGGGRNLERAVLGECLAMPVSFHQHILFEPIDRALCSPIGRGTGTTQDDLYTFGVSLAMLLRHNDPTEGLTDEQIIEQKMDEGTYMTLLGSDRFSGAILELLRGLLYDDPQQRWTLDDILVWLDGRRLSPKQAARRSKATRPILFNGHKYLRTELLSRDLHKNISEARLLIEGGELDQWLQRAMDDKPLLARYDNAVKLSGEGGKNAGYAEQLATRVAIALDPAGPIRYRGISLFPDGVGAALTEAYLMKRNLQAYIDFFLIYFVTQWVDSQPSGVADSVSLVGKFDSARAFLRQKGFGAGIEKCIYTLNPEVHCLSDKLQKFHVRSPEELLYAYEKMSYSAGRPISFLDRHIVAFLSVKDRKNIDPYIHELNSPENHKRILAEMKSVATIQKRSRMEKFPGIAAWMAENLEPVYERFHDREMRADLRKKVERLKEHGDLGKIVALFDNPITYQDDFVGFREAMRHYFELEQEGVDIEYAMRDEANYGRDTGRQVAAMVAAVITGIVILATVFSSFSSAHIM